MYPYILRRCAGSGRPDYWVKNVNTDGKLSFDEFACMMLQAGPMLPDFRVRRLYRQVRVLFFLQSIVIRNSSFGKKAVVQSVQKQGKVDPESFVTLIHENHIRCASLTVRIAQYYLHQGTTLNVSSICFWNSSFRPRMSKSSGLGPRKVGCRRKIGYSRPRLSAAIILDQILVSFSNVDCG